MNAPASVARTLEQLAILGELPSPKGVALAILELCRREDATLPEVARVAQVDPASNCPRRSRSILKCMRAGMPRRVSCRRPRAAKALRAFSCSHRDRPVSCCHSVRVFQNQPSRSGCLFSQLRVQARATESIAAAL
jgi:hypothetical protein